LSVASEAFWGAASERIEDLFGAVEISREPAALAERLGGFPFWRGESPFLDILSRIYAAASPHCLDVFLGPDTGVDRSGSEYNLLYINVDAIANSPTGLPSRILDKMYPDDSCLERILSAILGKKIGIGRHASRLASAHEAWQACYYPHSS
jgi:hypothetical protein